MAPQSPLPSHCERCFDKLVVIAVNYCCQPIKRRELKVETGIWKISVETEKQRKASSQESSQQTGGGENVISNHTAHFEECSGHSDVLLAQNVLKEDQRKNTIKHPVLGALSPK